MSLTLYGNKQWYIDVEKEEWKLETIMDIHETVTITRALIFCDSEEKVFVLAGHMRSRRLEVYTLVSLLLSLRYLSSNLM
jgi:superfamily II DNA/RNA helicase